MELVIAKQSMLSQSECANYTVPDGMWARFKFEGCYPDGKGTISKGGTLKGQLSMNVTELVVRESGTYEACVTGKNTKSSIYVELIHESAATVVVAAGTNVTVNKSQVNNVTTYTVNAKDDDSKTVIAAGQNITVSSTKSGDTTTWTINGTEQGSHTEVRAGTNTTVTSATEGNKTVYTVNATVPASRTYKVASTTPNTLTVSESTSGNTTTFNLAATGGGTGTDVEITSTDSNLIITKV